METQKALALIREEWSKRVDADPTIRGLKNKIQAGKGTYEDAQKLAMQAGSILSDVFREKLPNALTDGKLVEDVAKALIKQPMLDDYKFVSEQTAQVQRSLNEQAGLEIDAIIPEANENQIDGIIHGISTADNYRHYEESFLDQVENFSEGIVDDSVRENADFHYKAGLSPTIERKSDGKCCAWCSALVGIYQYEDVSQRGADVYRRHRNCHCQVLYNPGDGSNRRQNVHTRQWNGKTEAKKQAAETNTEKRYEAEPAQKKILKAAFNEQLKRKDNILTDIIIENHKALSYFTPEEMYNFLKETGYTAKTLAKGNFKDIEFKNGGGYKINYGGDGIFQYHPEERSHHGKAYWKVTSGKRGEMRYDVESGDAIAD